jgi:hypothetical protein
MVRMVATLARALLSKGASPAVTCTVRAYLPATMAAPPCRMHDEVHSLARELKQGVSLQ